ncbi:MAG: hypothetical protein Q9219_002628 [cf. Caloplaca sp. 3 TL-2023]
MASFKRGNSNSKKGFVSARGGSSNRFGGKRSGPYGGVRPDTAKSAPFKTSRVDEVIKPDPEDSDATQDPNNSDVQSQESSSHESSSDSDAGYEKPYSILLQALNPPASRGEPKRKKRKFEPAVFVEPSRADLSVDLDITDRPEDEDDMLEIVADESEADEPVKKHDFFANHLAPLDESEIAQRVEAIKGNRWATHTSAANSSWSASFRHPITSKEQRLDNAGRISDVREYNFKPKFEGAAGQLLSTSGELSIEFASSIFRYRDVLFSARSLENADVIRRLTVIHCLNHVFRTRDKVLRNTAKLSKIEHDEDVEYRDQGFTRPKVLVLLPTRQSCVKFVDAIVALCEPEQQESKKKFQDSYSRTETHLSADKPMDFQDLFEGNDDDMFRLGLKFTRKAIKYFSQFYNSDIILASPLGLRTALGGGKTKKPDSDFLSSIEIVVVDQSDALLMQNWEHIEYVFEHLSLQPKEAHGCDFSRVRNWYLDGHARYLRQSILLSAYNFPALNKLYTQNMLNVDGKVKISRKYDGAIAELGVSIKQTFSRFDLGETISEPDVRFDYFSTAVLPTLTKPSPQSQKAPQGTLIFIPLYADFVRIRNHLASSSSTQHISFGTISEYTSVKDVSRARSHFLSGRHSLLLYTERAHHFRRYHLKGVEQVILYGLPENPLFYIEIVGGFLSSNISQGKVDSHRGNVRGLFSRLDLLKLERIVGTSRYLSLMNERGDTFDFT